MFLQEDTDLVFTMETVPLKFGPGVTEEVGVDLVALGVRRALLVTDSNLVALGLADRVCAAASAAGVALDVFDRVRSEPTEASWQEAIAFARVGSYDGFVGLGGGSSLDTAKAVNLYTTYPADLGAYLNRPIGEGRPVPGPLKPLIAIPTTAGTASETTSVAIVELLDLHLKTGISHRALRPRLALIDPLNTLSLPPGVTASTGIDVVTHALESYTARPYTARPRPEDPTLRPPYCGANPISDIWCEKSLRLAVTYLPRAVRDGSDLEARTQMILASTYAGFGFGNAGVHVPHAMGYPIAGQVRDYLAPDYSSTEPMVPHGIAVSVGAPAAFRFTGPAAPERHLQAAEWLGAEVAGRRQEEAGAVLADALAAFMRTIGLPVGLRELGYRESDLPALAAGAYQQQRLLELSPRPVTKEDLSSLFREAL